DTVSSVRMGPDMVFIEESGGEPVLRGSAAPLETDEAVIAAYDARMGDAELVGADWLRVEMGREERDAVEARWIDADQKLALPPTVACTDDEGWPMCGAYTELGPWLLVVEDVSCG